MNDIPPKKRIRLVLRARDGNDARETLLAVGGAIPDAELDAEVNVDTTQLAPERADEKLETEMRVAAGQHLDNLAEKAATTKEPVSSDAMEDRLAKAHKTQDADKRLRDRIGGMIAAGWYITVRAVTEVFVDKAGKG